VDTLAWEGFREAVDDIRYFTLLMTEVQRCKQSPNLATRQKAAQVLMWWADQKSTEVNLETLRMEIINYVAQLRAMN
jgi:hypothetical protein